MTLRNRLLLATAAVLVVNSGYLIAAQGANLFHAAQILLHPVLGITALKLMLWAWKSIGPALRRDPLRSWFWISGSLLALTGAGLFIFGSAPATRLLLYAHLASAAGFTVLLVSRRVLLAPLLLAAAIPVGALLRPVLPDRGPVLNAGLPPATMAGEAMGGTDGPFFPSSAETEHGGLIPEEFFLESDKCGRCHGDITHQWSESAHRFASFNNPWYRRSIEYMQSVVGVTPSKWCAGCHDHAVLFSGQMDRPVAEIVDRPSASAGLGCVSCHAITRVKDTMGNAGFVIEYPEMHDLAASEDPLIRTLHDLVIHLDPEPHRQAFLKTAPHRRQLGVLLHLPQGASRPARQRLPLAPGFQQLRQLAGERGFGRRRALVLLPGVPQDVRRLPHAAGRRRGPGGAERPAPLAPLRRRKHRAPDPLRARRAAPGRSGFPARRTGDGGHLRSRARRPGGSGGVGNPPRRRRPAGARLHLRGRRGSGNAYRTLCPFGAARRVERAA